MPFDCIADDRSRVRSQLLKILDSLWSQEDLEPHSSQIIARILSERFERRWRDLPSVSLILDLLAGGMTAKEILADYPDLDEAEILACITYGVEMARERYVDIPVKVS